jgi:hypothetical protein
MTVLLGFERKKQQQQKNLDDNANVFMKNVTEFSDGAA